jgi:hypothetical protein
MKKDNESITFRLSSSFLESLRKEALENHTSVNTLVTRLISEHEKWHKYAKSVGFISMPKDFQRLLLDNITKNQLIEITEKKADNCKDAITLLRSNYDLDSFFDVIETWFTVSGFSYRKDVDTDKIKLTVHHDMGEKWSIFLSILCQRNFEKLTNEKTLVEITDKTVIIVVPIK